MARRRSEDGYDDLEPTDGGFGGDDGSPLLGGGGPDPQNPFGNGRDRPDAFYDLSPEEQQSIIDMQGGAIAGNTDTARELGPQMPNVSRPQQPFQLPQGVSVNESMGGGGDYSQDAPAMPMEPSPAAAQRANPTFAPQGSQQPTRRVSAAPSALFGEQGTSSMFGKAGGLLGGGIGVPGAGSDGEIEPTEMLKKLLMQFRQQV